MGEIEPFGFCRDSARGLREGGEMRSWGLYLGLAVLWAAGCTQASAPTTGPVTTETLKPFAGKSPIRVVCTTGMVADVLRNVGGQHVEVKQLMGAGVDPHLYKESPHDESQMKAADLIFYSGLHLEGKMADRFERMSHRKPTFALTARLPENRILKSDSGFPDPHVWFDVGLWSETVEFAREVLVKFDPPHAGDYNQAAQKYRDELKQLDDECRKHLASIPEEQRVLVTAHDAFHYFGRAYDVEVKAIQGVSTASEAGVKQINELVAFLAKRKIKAVFVETSVSERNIRALVEGCQQAGHTVEVGGELFSDAMGEPGTPAGTYIGMVRHNVETIVKALK